MIGAGCFLRGVSVEVVYAAGKLLPLTGFVEGFVDGFVNGFVEGFVDAFASKDVTDGFLTDSAACWEAVLGS